MEQRFTTVIVPKTGWFDFHLKEVLKYRDLIFLFVKRNFVSQYKQTILGPVWFVVQPALTVIMYMILFPATAFTVGFLVRFFLNRSFLAYMGSAFICLIVTGLVQGLKVLMTDSFTVEVFVTVVVQTLISLPLAVLCYFPPMRFRESLS